MIINKNIPIKNIYYCLVDYVCVSSKYRGTGTSDELIKYATEILRGNISVSKKELEHKMIENKTLSVNNCPGFIDGGLERMLRSVC